MKLLVLLLLSVAIRAEDTPTVQVKTEQSESKQPPAVTTPSFEKFKTKEKILADQAVNFPVDI